MNRGKVGRDELGTVTYSEIPVQVVRIRATVEFDAVVQIDDPRIFEEGNDRIDRFASEVRDAVEYHAGHHRDFEADDGILVVLGRGESDVISLDVLPPTQGLPDDLGNYVDAVAEGY